MNSSQTKIGEIVSVSGNVISVQLSDSIKSNMPIIDGVVYRIGQIGTFLKIPLGYASLYGIVTQIGAAAIPDKLKELVDQDYTKLDNKQWLNIVLVGEQSGQKFERSVSQSPTTGDNVHLVTIKDLDVIYGGYDESNSITIGNISLSESLSAKIDLNKLVSRHCAILGSTGSGKSNAVGVVLKSIADKEFKRSRILVIDPHGEYNSVLKSHSNVYKIKADSRNQQQELFIPFWALPFDELMSIFSGSLNPAQEDFFREKIIEYKHKGVAENNISIEVYLVTADSPIPFSLKQLWFDLDDLSRQTFREMRKPETVTEKIKNGDAETLISNEYEAASAGGGAPFLNNDANTNPSLLKFLNTVRTKLNDSRYEFLFSPEGYMPNLD
ncbi:Bipolar DNA helicase HerA, partial [hydrothermal vent metagenome]